MCIRDRPRGAIRTKDITGGLTRVAEIFEAREPKDAAEIAKIDGIVDFRGTQKNKRIIVVRDEVSGMEEEHQIPLGEKFLIIQNEDSVVRGQPLTNGLVKLQEILEICGVTILQKYLVDQVQEVYRLQGVDINDKHVEIIVRQMLQKVRITDPGDTIFLYGEDVSKKVFNIQNAKVIEEGARPAQAQPVLLGITKASLGTDDSWVSAASFQETTRILTDAASAGKHDLLLDPKSNVIMGNQIPVGTGFFAFEERVSKGHEERQEELEFAFAD